MLGLVVLGDYLAGHRGVFLVGDRVDGEEPYLSLTTESMNASVAMTNSFIDLGYLFSLGLQPHRRRRSN